MRMTFFSPPDAEESFHVWGANCGPASVAALCGLTLAQLRPYLGGFEKRKYANPTHVKETLDLLGVRYQVSRDLPSCGLVFVQWHGPWMEPGRPVFEAYRHTHWTAWRDGAVYDVNVGHWVCQRDWTDPENGVAAWLMKQHPGASGVWAVRSALHIDPGCLPARPVGLPETEYGGLFAEAGR